MQEVKKVNFGGWSDASVSLIKKIDYILDCLYLVESPVAVNVGKIT